MKKHFAAFILSLAVSVSAFAQASAGTGAVSGTVRDASGSVIAGASVTLTNESLGVRRSMQTSDAGLFSASALVPSGGYALTVAKPGFANYEVKDFNVAVGQNVSFSVNVSIATAATTVSVTAEAPLIETDKTDVSQVVSSQQILDLPINGRRVDNFVLLTPGVTTDGPFGLISFRGNPGGNSFLTDGNDTTNQFYNENAGRTRTTNIGQDSIQEFQVVSSNFLAEYGRASGGVVNTVTRSGSNSTHGTLYWFFRNRTLNASDITTLGINPPEWRHQAGASLGGPITKNKIFYFFNGELQRRNFPLVSSNLIGSAILDLTGAPKANVCVAPATAAQCAAATAYVQGRAAPQLVPRTADTNLLFGKIDYRPDDRNTFSFSANYLDFRSPNGIQTQLSLANGDGVGNNADTNVFDRTGRIEWTNVVSPSAVNSLRFGYFKDRQYDPASPSLLPSIGPVALTVQGTTNLGYANGYPRLNPSEQRWQLADTFSINKGSHALKFGVDFSTVEDYVERLANQYGTYSYTTLTNFALDFSGNTTGAKNYSSFTQLFGNPKVDVRVSDIDLFIQDQWHVTPKLVISPGVRYEHTFIPQPELSNPAFPQTGHIPGTNKDFAPRIGIAYTLNNKTVARVGYGMFFNRYTSSTIENFFLTNGLYQQSLSLNNATLIGPNGPVFPNRLPAPPIALGLSTLFFPAKDWRNPYSQQGTAAIERQVAKDTSLTVSYVWSLGLHLLQTRDLNTELSAISYDYPILDTAGNQVSSFKTRLYLFPRPNPSYGFIGQAEATGKSYYDAMLVQLTRKYSRWFMGNLSYTWSHSIDNNQGGGGNTLFGSTFATSVYNGDYNFEKGDSSSDQRHRLVVNAIIAPTLTHSSNKLAQNIANGWQLSLVTLAGSSFGIPPTITVQDKPFIPGQTAAINTLNTSVNGLGGSFRVPFEGPTYLKLGDIYRTDGRIQKGFSVTERVKVNLFFEAFNVFNHVQVAGSGARTARQYTTIKQTSGPLNGITALVPFAGYGTIVATQAPPDGTTARRGQVGIRILF